MARTRRYGRYAAGAAATIALVVLWLGDVISQDLIMAPIIGFVGGFLLRTWWSVIATPLTALAAAFVMDFVFANDQTANESELALGAAIFIGVVLLLLAGACGARSCSSQVAVW